MRQGRAFGVLLVLVGAVAVPGCVRQTLAIRSNPPGARTFVNGRFVGDTPVTTPFEWYTNYMIHIEKFGYLPVDERRAVRAPWYLRIPLDLAMEALPWTVKDERHFTYDLAPAADGAGPPLWPITAPAAKASNAVAPTPATKGTSVP